MSLRGYVILPDQVPLSDGPKLNQTGVPARPDLGRRFPCLDTDAQLRPRCQTVEGLASKLQLWMGAANCDEKRDRKLRRIVLRPIPDFEPQPRELDTGVLPVGRGGGREHGRHDLHAPQRWLETGDDERGIQPRRTQYLKRHWRAASHGKVCAFEQAD